MDNIDSLTVYEATSFIQRLQGLLGRSALDYQEALHIAPCRDVHSFGMKYSLDILFLDTDRNIVKTGLLKPNRWMLCKEASSVIELKEGGAQLYGLSVGTKVKDIDTLSIGKRNEY